jgi:aryl-alcohol dehydrogenase-like predicted oxidoreductase
MKKRKVGDTDLHVTELGLGGAPLGNLYYAISNEEAN